MPSCDLALAANFRALQLARAPSGATDPWIVQYAKLNTPVGARSNYDIRFTNFNIS